MRICIFDWNGGGHNPGLMLRFAESLAPDAEVILAAPDRELELAGEQGDERYPLGEPRPRPARPAAICATARRCRRARWPGRS